MIKRQRQSGFRSGGKVSADAISAFAAPIRQMYRASAHLTSGVAAAVADGYRTYAETLASADVDRPDFDNGFITGIVNGWVAALQQAPHILKDSFDTLRDATSSERGHKSRESSEPEHKSQPSSATRRKRARVSTLAGA
jgi:hypothetical protein